MEELLNAFWEAMKSGELQAILATLFALIAAVSPIWAKLISASVTKWKIKYDAKKSEAKEYLATAIDVSKKATEVLEKVDAFIENENLVNEELANWMGYITEHSTLTDEQKAYAKSYSDKIKKAIEIVVDNTTQITAIETEKDDELPIQTITEDIPNNL